MTTKAKTLKAWAVKTPEDGILTQTICPSKEEAEQKFLDYSFLSMNCWRMLHRMGYRSIPVRIIHDMTRFK